MSNIMWFADLGLADLEQVGGKNSSLGRWSAICRRPVCVCRTASPLPQTRIGVSSVIPGWRPNQRGAGRVGHR